MKRLIAIALTGLPLVCGADPTGAVDFTVEAPRNRVGATVDAAVFGVSPDAADNVAAMNRALGHCRERGAARLVVPKGIYRFTADRPIKMAEMRDFVLDGGGSTFVFLRKEGPSFLFARNERTEVRNLSVDWDWSADPLGSIVEVVEADARHVDFRFVDYGRFPRRDVRAAYISAWDGAARAVGVRGLTPLGRGFDMAWGATPRNDPKKEWLSDNVLRIHRGASNLPVGSRWRMQHYYYDLNCFVLDSNRHLRIEDVDVRSCVGFAFLIRGAQRYTQFNRVNIRPPADDPRRVITCTADHLHVERSNGWLKLENCDFALGADDCLNVHDCTAWAPAVSAANALEVRNGGAALDVGDLAEIRNADYSPCEGAGSPEAGLCRVVAKRPVEGNPRGAVLTFDRPVPPRTHRDGFIVFNRSFCSDNVVLRNCTFRDNRARGVIIQASDVTVEKCRFSHNESQALKITTGWTEDLWCEGTGVTNCVVRNCTFENCRAGGDPADMIVLLSYLHQPSYDKRTEKSSHPVIDGVLFDGNRIVGEGRRPRPDAACGRIVQRGWSGEREWGETCDAASAAVWPNDQVQVVAGRSAAVKTAADRVTVRSVGSDPTVWPAVYFTFPTPRDLSQAGAVRVTLSNRTDRAVRIGIKVKGKTVQGQLPDASFTVPPQTHATEELRLFAESWAFDKPHGLLGLKRNPGVGGGSSYSLEKVKSISVYLPAGIRDAAFDVLRVVLVPGDGQGNRLTILKADSFCPWVDEFGQANFAEWPDKVHSREEFLARTAAEAKELAEKPTGIPDADRFGGWAAGPRLNATGFFRTEKVNGKWWLVDPDGHLFLSHGVNCGWELAGTGVSGRESYFERLPPKEGETKQFWTYHTKPVFRNYYGDPKNAPFWSFSFSAYDIWLKFGTDWRRKNIENTARRLRSWGLNTTTGASRELRTCPGRVPYVVGIGPTSRKIEGAKGYWGNLLDPFAPEFERSCRIQAKGCQAAGTNEWCIGWTANNELSWGADGAALARGVLASPDDQPAKIALLGMLADRGIAPERATEDDLRRLGEAVAEKYYSTVRAAIKAFAPNHLYLGDRNDKRNPEVFRAAARNVDVVTVNAYERRPTVTLPADAEDKPLMVTEFHFGCYDTGYFYASLIPVKDQKARAECYRDYWRAVVDSPAYVGAHWFCWRDCPITGQLGEGANAQCGLVSTADVPYSELVSAIRDISREMYSRRYSAGK